MRRRPLSTHRAELQSAFSQEGGRTRRPECRWKVLGGSLLPDGDRDRGWCFCEGDGVCRGRARQDDFE